MGRVKASWTVKRQLSAASSPGQSRKRLELLSKADVNCLSRLRKTRAASISSGSPTRPRRIVRAPRLSTGPWAASPRRGSTSCDPLANSSAGSGRTSIFSGRAIDQTSFLNIHAEKTPFEQKVIHMAVADVDRRRILRKETRPKSEIAFDIGVAVELDATGGLAGPHIARQRGDAIPLREHIERFDANAPH